MLTLAAATPVVAAPDSSTSAAPAPLAASLGALPLSFEPNVGQFNDDISFYVRGAGCSIAVAPGEARLLLTSSHRPSRRGESASRSAGRSPGRAVEPAAASREVRFELLGGNRLAPATGEESLPGIVNYLLGNDPSIWKTGIGTFARARFNGVYPGIDLVYYGNQSQLEYDFVVAPRANPDLIRLRFTGADDITLDAAGDLVLHLDGKQLRWRKPVAYQSIAGARQEVTVSYRLLPGGRVEFALGEYDATQELVIDPLLVYATYLGGADLDSIQSMTVDKWGNTYFTGATYSTNFPVFRAYRTNPYAYADAFVTKLNSNATALVFSTYFGGGSNDWANSIAVDSGSNVFIAGFTDSVNLPTRNAFKDTAGVFGDAFLARFGPFGSNLVYSTYLGDGSGNFPDYDEAFAVAVNNSGGAWIAGGTASGSAFPSKAPIQNGFGGGFQDAMVARFDTSQSGAGSLVWATWLGGNYSDVAYGIAVDTNDNCYVVGTMLAEFDDFGEILPASFPVVNAYQPNYGGGFNDGFLVKISNAGNPSRVFATFLGGDSEDSAYGVWVDSASQAYVCGETASLNFPVVNGHQSGEADGSFFSDAFVSKFNGAGSALLYSTYFGGTRSDGARSVIVDRLGHIYLAGYTQSGDLPVTPDAVKLTLGGIVGDDSDLFAAKINPLIPGASSLIFATYYGGSDREAFGGDFDFWSLFAPANLGVGLGLDAALNFYIASDTFSTNLPKAGGATYRTNAIGAGDVFAAKISSPLDISVSMIGSVDDVVVGSNVIYSVFVHNNGPSTFTNVVATVVLPAKLQFLGATNSPGVVSNVGNTVYFAYGNLTNSAARQSTILAKALTPDLGITNLVNLTASPIDANTNNNRAAVVTEIRGIANLALGMTANANPTLASSNLTYTISITNLGPWTATDVLVTNPVPAGLTYVGAVASQGPTAIAADLVYAFLGTLPPNAVATVTVTYQTGDTLGSVTNRTGVYHRKNNELDPATANNVATIVTTINPLTDVVIGASANSFAGPILYAGSNLTYQVFITNNGPSAASSVFVTNVLPVGVAYVSATVTRGTVVQAGGVVTWNVTSLASNQSANLSVVMRPTLAGLLTNTAVITSSAADPILANNTSSAVSQVQAAADVGVSMIGSVGTVVVTSNLVYTLSVTNRGPTLATNVILTATLPPNTLFLGAPVSQGTTQLVGNVFNANLGQLNSGTAATIMLTLRPMLEGAITTPVTVTSGIFDPVLGNNSLNLNTTVTAHPDGPILRIARAGTNVVLYWTTNSPGYALFNKPDELAGSFWRSVTNVPVVRGTQFFVTNTPVYNPLSIQSSAGYYRLQRTLIQPALTIRLAGTNVTLSWPVNFASYFLQRTAGIQTSNSWVTVTNIPTLQTGRYYLNQPIVGPASYYRLRAP